MALIAEAIAWYEAGYMPLPVKPDGSKAPAVTSWTQFQKQRPSLAETIELFKIDSDGIGLLCGAVSGHLEMFELEGRAVDEGYLERLEQAFADHHDLFDKIMSGYSEVTPSGGMHFYYRIADGEATRNTKLARRPATPDELSINPDEKLKVLIETRGEGGFVVIAPSAGRTHSSGKAWEAIGNSIEIPMLSVDERCTLFAISQTLDQMPVHEPPPASKGPLTDVSGNRPGDEFNDRASWKEVLEPHGWTCHKHYGGNLYGWRKPGKRQPGISATTGRNDADCLYVFSTSTEFEPERPYSKFGAHAVLNFSGDHSAAARDLRQRGYGDQGTKERVKPLTPEEKLAHLLEGILRAEPMLRKAQVHWAAAQIHQQHPPDALSALRKIAARTGMSDADIDDAIGSVK